MNIPEDILEVFEVRLVGTESNKPVGVHAGDVYEFAYGAQARSGIIHRKGEQLRVVDSTTDVPHNELSVSGHNWICETDHGRSVWAILERCISTGMLRKVNPASPGLTDTQSR